MLLHRKPKEVSIYENLEIALRTVKAECVNLNDSQNPIIIMMGAYIFFLSKTFSRPAN